MRLTLILALALVVAAASGLPQRCRNPRGCRSVRPTGRPLRAPVGALRSPARPPRTQAAGVRRPAKRPTPTTAPAAPSSVELAAAPLSEDQFDVKPQVGVDGWLASPKRTTQPAIEARTEPPSKADKPGSCDTPKGFGIKCMTRLDQCMKDHECPGSTKCCMVGECGYLCVKPKRY
ncbi:uncharacterized protein LOC119584344 isoform X2 [Penaeus monodon]|uniref:uncharacterized protein LOC119584344 isoform X2 n=1 Tax=Penaeus monodon TaxID=6687 RepID=UPI0018A6EA34|nr:uncharacterized protein LOC119584344 isoform X2 [Penaeus monodon]